MTIPEILRAAAERIRTGGWCQGRLGDCDGPVCALGAIKVAMGGHPLGALGDTGRAALKAVNETVGADSLVLWNDAPGRTAEQVIEAFEATARRPKGGAK